MEIEELSKKALEDLGEVSDEKALEVWRIKYLGRKSQLNNILRSLEDLPVEERKAVGAAANKVKTELEHALEKKRQKLEEERLGRMAGESVDLSLPGYPFSVEVFILLLEWFVKSARYLLRWAFQ